MSTSEPGLLRLHAIIRGRVQGVGFRYFVRRKAAALGVRGFVRNTRDGSVEVTAEGDRATLAQLLDELRRGPSAASVAAVDHQWSQGSGEFSGFQVRL